MDAQLDMDGFGFLGIATVQVIHYGHMAVFARELQDILQQGPIGGVYAIVAQAFDRW